MANAPEVDQGDWLPDSTGLIGRAGEVAAIAGLLARGESVVVTGEAGIGKSAVIHRAVSATTRRSFVGGAYSTLTWMEHLPLRRAIGRPVARW